MASRDPFSLLCGQGSRDLEGIVGASKVLSILSKVLAYIRVELC